MITKKFTYNDMVFKVKVKTCAADEDACSKCAFHGYSELCLAAPECYSDEYFEIKRISTV